MKVKFDDSLHILVKDVAELLGDAALSSGVVVRDVTGRLAFVASTKLEAEKLEALSGKLKVDLEQYARTDRVVADPEEIGVAALLSDPIAMKLTVDGRRLRIIDRRLAGADWQRYPAPVAPPPPRFVFCSLKGGVGRSTSLSVAAADLASTGRRVLAIDLDMEAPGLGTMLLDQDTTPEFGLIDALVESALSALDDTFVADLVGPSALADNRGRIDVMPAFGARSLRNPGEILAKIARAYVEKVEADGIVLTLLDRVRHIVDRLADPLRYDAILIDARSGLHETTAAAILGLGADIYLFGLDEPQTFVGYSALFAHLARFVSPGSPPPEWLERITMVQAKASAGTRELFAENCRQLFARLGLASDTDEVNEKVPLPAGDFRDVPWDDNVTDADLSLVEASAPREIISILEDERFRLFDPLRRRDLLSTAIYRSSFGMLLDRITEIVTGEGT